MCRPFFISSFMLKLEYMFKDITPKEGHALHEAIVFLVNNYEKSGHNDKPVIFHSLQVAYYLFSYNYNLDIIMGAILHDLIEDSDVTKNDIDSVFGNKIAELVDSVSFDVSIKNKEDRYREMFNRTKKFGFEALIVKCADLYINSHYIKFAEGNEIQISLVKKLEYFLEFSKDQIGSEPVWKDLYESSKVEQSRIQFE